jgi:hypothetical protein
MTRRIELMRKRRMKMFGRIWAIATMVLVFGATKVSAQESAEELAKKLANPFS